MSSRAIGNKSPARPHILQQGGGVAAEVTKLRKDVDEGFVDVEGRVDLLEAPQDLLRSVDDGPLDGGYREVTPAGAAFPSSVIWWDSAGKNTKKLEVTVTRDGAQRPTVIVWKAYNGLGVLLTTITDTIVYSGAYEAHRTRTYA